MAGRLIALIALAVIIVGGAAAVDSAFVASGEQTTITNESWTPDAGNVTTLNNSHLSGVVYDRNVTVYDENGTEMTASTDYRWFQANGTVKALTGGGLDGDSTANITYGYADVSTPAQNAASLFGHSFQVAQLLIVFLGVGFAFAGMRVLGGL